MNLKAYENHQKIQKISPAEIYEDCKNIRHFVKWLLQVKRDSRFTNKAEIVLDFSVVDMVDYINTLARNNDSGIPERLKSIRRYQHYLKERFEQKSSVKPEMYKLSG